MNTKVLLTAVFFVGVLSGCKNQHKEDVDNVVQEETVTTLPNKSDAQFAAAIDALYNDKPERAVESLKKGIEALKKEGKDLKKPYKGNLAIALGQLQTMLTNLENGVPVPAEFVQESVANAEINIAHDYLTSDEVYVLQAPEHVKSSREKKRFDRALRNLKKEQDKVQGLAKEENESLMKEGEELDKEYAQWEKKAQDFTQSANVHFKEHSPQYYDQPYYWAD
ncbi:hypothetical protein K8352_10795 [Flavobacteriaceae bacterium F89]|jgi:prefoldin subunit 5|uniref:Lipoprotein n=1 Tax=Cerina litoralis TaxID=2874477 RepID=A0AAE3JT70_9FLAO|nr:hypothetical protein [Cerina litoralis]MCG2461237.1 hypothetical protein [Cerina litoralis]